MRLLSAAFRIEVENEEEIPSHRTQHSALQFTRITNARTSVRSQAVEHVLTTPVNVQKRLPFARTEVIIVIYGEESP